MCHVCHGIQIEGERSSAWYHKRREWGLTQIYLSFVLYVEIFGESYFMNPKFSIFVTCNCANKHSTHNFMVSNLTTVG